MSDANSVPSTFARKRTGGIFLALACLCSALLAVAHLLVAQACAQTNQDATAATGLPSVELPELMFQPIILPNSAASMAVCLQWIPWEWSDSGRSVVRVVVVDLEQLEIVASRDLESARLSCAVGDDELYLANNDTLRVEALSLRDLTPTRSAELPAEIGELFVVAGKLLSSKHGLLRLDLPEFVPSKVWARPAEWSGANGKGISILSRVEDGWLVDGIVYDETLTQPKLIGIWPHRRDGKVSADQDMWGRAPAAKLDDWVPAVKPAVSTTIPLAVHAARPANLGENADIPIHLIAEHIGHGVVAEVYVDTISDSGGRVRQQLTTRHLELRKAPIIPRQDGLLPVSLSVIGNRALVAVDRRLFVWEVETDELVGSFRFKPQQSHTLIDFEKPTHLRHSVVGALGEVDFVADYNVPTDSQSADPASGVVTITVEQWTRNRFEHALNVAAPVTLRRLLGREPKGLVFPAKVVVRATDTGASEPTTAAISYSVIYEVPEAVSGPITAARDKLAAERRAVTDKKRSEQQAASQERQSAARRTQERKAIFSAAIKPLVWAVIVLAVGGPFAMIFAIARSRRRNLVLQTDVLLSNDLPVASRGQRFANYSIDYVATNAYAGVVCSTVGTLVAISRSSSGRGFTNGELLQLQILGAIIGLCVTIFYYALMETLFQRTLGKFITGTLVVTSTGSRPTFEQIVGRTFARLIPFDFVTYLSRGKHPVGWHDGLSNTRVVALRSKSLKP